MARKSYKPEEIVSKLRQVDVLHSQGMWMSDAIRRECTDHLIVLGEAHLRRVLRAYSRYYNNIRPGPWAKMHRSLAPFTAPEPLVHTRSLADFITTASGFRFSVQTGNSGAVFLLAQL